MAGLVGYASSDEDEDIEQSIPLPAASAPDKTASKESEETGAKETKNAPEDAQEPPPQPQLQPPPQQADQTPVVGPSRPTESAGPVGPTLPPAAAEIDDDAFASAVDAPGSPYTANRAMIHDLTLPSVPNLDIPPSPPGSPPPAASKKFEQFLDLKKKGVHFNAKLENSTALRNPSLMEKLLDFVDIDSKSQYETTLPRDMWDPTGFPPSAYYGQLRRNQERMEREREAEKAGGGRSTVEFVPASQTGGAVGTGGLSRGEKRKGGWN